jgi:hypothetical protein
MSGIPGFDSQPCIQGHKTGAVGKNSYRVDIQFSDMGKLMKKMGHPLDYGHIAGHISQALALGSSGISNYRSGILQ